jgi:Methyltransferase domain
MMLVSMGLLPPAIERKRRDVSKRFLSGRGVEIGALHSPLWVSDRAFVTQVDRRPVSDLRKHYPELNGHDLVNVDVIDDGERLTRFGDGSLDFIIANHMLEHCESLLGTLRNHLAKIKIGGYLYYAVPDKRHTFDVDRAMTSFDHLVQDEIAGPEWSRRAHFLDWSRVIDKAPDDEAATRRAQQLIDMNYSIHFHVWDADRYREILVGAHEYLGRGFQVVWFEQNEFEVISVLRKCPPLADNAPLFVSPSLTLKERVHRLIQRRGTP